MTMNRDTELRALVQAKATELRSKARENKHFGGSLHRTDLFNELADELEALLARTEAGAVTFANAGDSEAQFIADGENLNCPTCGGSGHVGDVLSGHGLLLKSGVSDRNDNFVGTFRDWDMAAFVGEMLVKADADSHPEYTGFQIIATHPHDASARLSEVERKSVTDLMESQVYEAGDVDDEPPSIDENEDAYWAYHNYHGLRKLLAALPSPPKENES